jgi:tetratricopeptide (TPR) repeat protein
MKLHLYILTYLPLCFSYAQIQTEILPLNTVQHSIELLKKKGSSTENNLQLADLYYSIENYATALRYYSKAFEKDPSNLHKFKMAQVSEKLGKYQQALTFYQDLWEADTLNNILRYRMSKLMIRLQHYDKALKNLTLLTQKDSLHPIYPYQVGMIYNIQNNYSKAIDYFLKTYRRDSSSIHTLYQLAYSFHKLHLRDSTEVFMKKGLKLEPEHKNLNRLKINLLRRDHQYQEAIDLLLEQDSLYNDDFFITKMLGISYWQLDQYEESKKWFEKAYEIDPEDFNSQTYLGHIAQKNKDFDLALVHYTRATRIGKLPRDEEYLGLGQVLTELNKPKEALQMFKRAVDENHKNHQAFFEYALATDRYYKDKRIGYRLYQKYLLTFSNKKNSKHLKFIYSRMKAIKEKLFLEGIPIE